MIIKNIPGIGEKENKMAMIKNSRSKRKKYADDGNYRWIKINLGHRDGISASELIKIINQNTRGKKVDLGRIDIQATSSRIQVEKPAVDFLNQALKRKIHKGKRIRLE